MLIISHEIPLGAGVLPESGPHDESNVSIVDKHKQSLITYSIDLMCRMGLHTTAAKHLLKMNRINDAIAVCQSAMNFSSLTSSQSQLSPSASSPKKQRQKNQLGATSTYDNGSSSVSSSDFFKCAVTMARNMKDINERLHLFHHLFTFLRMFDPHCLGVNKKPVVVDVLSTTPTRRRIMKTNDYAADDTKGRRCSFAQGIRDNSPLLSIEIPNFPNELFGGVRNENCVKIRQIFGYEII
mmetsp:Transcript_14063/g.17214  ORF Transcript_14063/g.17214 Transcript_14063/m.17214 type:complete len:239 (-) Transcript_14063:33-749(-)